MSGSTITSTPDLLAKDDSPSSTTLPTKYVKLNVGGALYYTTLGTLTKRADSMLRAMFSGRLEVLTDHNGWVLIDRCGKHFGRILNYLRDGTVEMPEGKGELKELLTECKFYCLEELCVEVEEELKKKGDELEPRCRITLVTSQKEEKMLIANSEKPVIKLVCSRYNNKYSYTSQSDDNILKNVELFDKLSLRFNGRILFIKDIITNDEICCWSFYGNGKKVTEVCCTSIVYATEKKQTKVEFHEARIYEETLNTLLYEDGRTATELSLVDQLQKASQRQREREERTNNSEDESGASGHRRRVHHTPSNE